MGEKELLEKLAIAIIEGGEEAAETAAKEIVAAGIDPIDAIQKGAKKGLDEIGERFQRLEAFLPDLIRGGEAMKACMTVFQPYIKAEQASSIELGKVVIGTVPGDIHDIGKSLVGNMLTASGFEVLDLGTDVPVKKFVEKAEEIGAKVIALSALMTTSSYYQEDVINYLKDMGLRDKYYVVVGGAPVTPEWTIQIGADGYGKTAVHASRLLERLVKEGISPPLSKPIIIESLLEDRT